MKFKENSKVIFKIIKQQVNWYHHLLKNVQNELKKEKLKNK